MRAPLILHYHVIGDVPRRWDPDNLAIDADRFRAQLRSVGRLGYRFVPLRELVGALATGRTMGDACALTFDDGSVDNLTILPGLLGDLKAPATVYACPGLAGTLHASFDPRAAVRLMEAEELRELAAIPGFEIGSHTLRHTSLERATRDQALSEMSSSKQALEEILDQPVRSFAYPGCGYSPACPAAARDTGYQSAVTCARRGSLDPFALRRTSPDRLDNRLTFALKARQMYDPLWSSLPGRAARRAARRARHGRRAT